MPARATSCSTSGAGGCRGNPARNRTITDHAHTLLSRKFKAMKGLSAADLAATVFVRVQPKAIPMLDYRRGFVWKKRVRV